MKPKPHLFRHDPEVPADHNGRQFCQCGAPADHERHTLPAVPEQAGHRARYDHDEEDGDMEN